MHRVIHKIDNHRIFIPRQHVDEYHPLDHVIQRASKYDNIVVSSESGQLSRRLLSRGCHRTPGPTDPLGVSGGSAGISVGGRTRRTDDAVIITRRLRSPPNVC